VATTTATHVTVHVFVTFANPYLLCSECGAPVLKAHSADLCGCDRPPHIVPCGHIAMAVSACPSWSPVDGCCCMAQLGHMPHPALPA
jgi:hypothetical protein